MDLFSFLSFHFMCVIVTVVTGHSVAVSRHSHLFSSMSSLHDVLVHDIHFPSTLPTSNSIPSTLAPYRSCHLDNERICKSN
jgi:hypothetical protein